MPLEQGQISLNPYLLGKYIQHFMWSSLLKKMQKKTKTKTKTEKNRVEILERNSTESLQCVKVFLRRQHNRFCCCCFFLCFFVFVFVFVFVFRFKFRSQRSPSKLERAL